MTDGFALKSWVINLVNKVSKKNGKYSTNETQVGTWIDGKPLYRRCVDIDKPSTSGENRFLHGIPDVDFITFYYPGSYIHVPDITDGAKGSIFPLDCNPNGGQPYHFFARLFSFQYIDYLIGSELLKHSDSKIHFCVLYTKTTDKATS